MTAPVDLGVPHVDWTTFYETLDWRQGEHLALLGRTGSGKSMMAIDLLSIRTGYTVAFGVKPKDETLDDLMKHEGYVRITSWPPKTRDMRKVVLWPRVRSSDDISRLSPVFKDALDSVFASLAWCVYLDEARYLTDRLGLRQELIDMWILGRAGKLSIVACSQRPSWVPPEMYTQATHVFLCRRPAAASRALREHRDRRVGDHRR
jgi:hypothetical protein